MQTTIEKQNEVETKNGNWSKDKRKEYSKSQALSRLGETRVNNHGSKMWIINYTDSQNITVQFEDGYIVPRVTYQQFCSGSIKSPNDVSVFGHGYIGVGEFKPYGIDSKVAFHYSIWSSMLQRCYSAAIKEKFKTYKDCTVCSEWLNYQTFSKWYTENYYDVGETLQIDKDILYPGNKHYSPETCVLVPKEVNVLFTKNDANRGDTPIGVSLHNGKYVSRCQIGTGKKESLGSFDEPQKAFEAYKSFKEIRIKQIADKYKGIIPDKLYDAMYKYKVKNDLLNNKKIELPLLQIEVIPEENVLYEGIISQNELVETCVNA